jgi:eukaryotic-like serine/threonine-protein kinase
MDAELTGRRFGVYQLYERVGAGGMGEVYRARDTRLQRDVAVKILPHAFTADPDRRARFEREARVLASLNHPNIATIHGVEDADGIQALVMELVEGETIADRLVRGAMPVADALAVARQIAEALDAAHERGIVHRDLKPANIKVTSTGLVKVLDFGLAKAVVGDDAGPETLDASTVAAFATHEGLVVGTPAYMSPEQMRGESVDKRTDIWAFGCVLYEMLTGRAAFARKTISDTIAAILDRDPDWESVRAIAPAPVWSVVRHCLAKDSRRRLRDIGDVRIQIDEILSASATTTDSATSSMSAVRTGKRLWVWASAALGITALAGAGAALLLNTPSASMPTPAQFTLSFAGQLTDLAITTVPAPSPDGVRFVFVGINEKGVPALWTRSVDSSESRQMPGTEGAQTPIWSPDGAWIGFFADGRLKKVPVSGGQPQTIATLPGFQEASWGSDGVIIFRPSNRQALFRISEGGGDATPLTKLNEALGENSHRGPTFLPDGRRFLFTSRCAVAANNALYLGSLDSPEIQRVMSAQSKALYLPAGPDRTNVLLYYRDGGLEARTFDANRNALGEPYPVIANADYNSAGIGAFFQAASNGRVIIVRPAGVGGNQLTWFDRSGQQTGTLGAPGDIWQPRLSPKGDRVAFTSPDPKNGNRDVWTIEFDRGIATPLTRNTANDWHAVWSADGTQLLFNSDRGGRSEGVLFIKRALDASAEEIQLLNRQSSPTDWSRDGRWIAVDEYQLNQGGPTTLIVSSHDRTAKRLIATQSRHGGTRFSPDGKWVAYTSDETGRFEVFVRPFVNGAVGDGKMQMSEAGGDFAVWRPDGQELYFMSEDATIHAVSTSTLRLEGPVPRPQTLFRPCPGNAPQSPPMTAQMWGNPFDTLDGKRFIVNCSLRPSREYVVLMNWPLTVRQ